MANLYALTGINPGDPTHLYIHVGDDGLITEMRQPPYRSADVAIKALVLGWDEYVPQEGEGSPLPKGIDEFKEYVNAVHGVQTYMVVLQW